MAINPELEYLDGSFAPQSRHSGTLDDFPLADTDRSAAYPFGEGHANGPS